MEKMVRSMRGVLTVLLLALTLCSLVTPAFAEEADTPLSFTAEEQAYLASGQVVRVGLNTARCPFSEYNEEDKTFTGINVDLLEEISKTTGLKFEYVPMTAGVKTADLLQSGDYDVICGIERDNFAASDTITATETFLQSAIVPVGRTGEEVNLNNSGTVVTFPSSFQALEKVLANKYPGLTLKLYDTNRECLDAVASGEADVFIQNTHILSRMLQEPKYENLSILPIEIMTEHTAMAMLKTEDPCLLSILNKAIRGMNQAVVSSSLIKHTFASAYQMTFGDFVYKFRIQITVAAVLIVACFLLLLRLAAVRRRSAKALQKKNAQLGEAMERAEQANATKSQFLARMSHEIRTPMNAIVGMTTLAKNCVRDPDRTMEYLDKIDLSSKVLLNIINDVLDMSAIESNKLKIGNNQFDFKELVTALSAMYYGQCKAKNIQFSIHLEGVTEEVLVGDSLRLNQILLNLLSNALKFTPSGGAIELRITQLSVQEKQTYLEFSVSDTGCGMSEEMLTRLFRPFEQANAQTAQKYGGSGLGLSITKSLVEMMHGTIRVQSRENEGSTFTVNLPFGVGAGQGQASSDQFKSIRALVVDDDKDTRDYTMVVLSRIGVQYECAASGEEAMKMLQSAHDMGSGYDICFVDWKMPGVDGVELTRRIRQLFDEDTIIIIVSAYDLSEVEEEAKAAGANIFVTKPLFQSTVFDVLMNLSGGKYKNVNADANTYDFTDRRVLLAEDNALNMEIATELLGMTHLEIVPAVDGKEALDLFRQSSPGTFDAILMDIQMPIMDGYEAAQAIRADSHPQAGTIPIYAMTANAFTEDINKALSCGMNGHIAKPIDTKLLYGTLQACFEKEANKAAPACD